MDRKTLSLKILCSINLDLINPLSEFRLKSAIYKAYYFNAI
ncbi:hypothetical protein ABEDC_0659 [Acinetobacter lwoffii]|nr:hypothetical protein ABEDC_0659 [Acinetobacter lwoffii]